MAAFTWAALTKSTTYAADGATAVTITAPRSVTGTGALTATDAPTGTLGMSLKGVDRFAVYVEAANSDATITTAIVLDAYVVNPWTGRASRAPKWDLTGTKTTIRSEYLDGYTVAACEDAWVYYIPSAGALSAGNLSIHVIASKADGSLL